MLVTRFLFRQGHCLTTPPKNRNRAVQHQARNLHRSHSLPKPQNPKTPKPLYSCLTLNSIINMVSESVYKDLSKPNKKLFKELVKLFDSKMYKKAFKICDKILATQADHSETIAMKALILNTIGKKKESNDLIQKAIMANFGSFTSWNIKGMIERSDKNFDAAKQCFSKSAQIEEGNQKIYRDLVLLELQCRDWQGAVKSMTQIMQKQARNKVYSTLYFLCQHLSGNFEAAESFIESNRDFLLNKMSRVEINELYLYEATLYRDHGKYEEAIDILKRNKESIVDQISKNELLAELCTKLGKNEEAISHYEFILERNPSSTKHYYGLFQAHGIDHETADEEGKAKIVEIINAKIEKHPRLLFLQRFLLNFLTSEEEFRIHFEKYCKRFLEKGIPSLVNDVEKLITGDSMKFRVVKETFEKYLETLQKDLSIDGVEQDPMQECFTLFYLSQVKYLEVDYFNALELVNESIEHTPTFIEAWQFKAKVYAALGDDIAAEEAFKTAHGLDTADRFLNAEYARYVLKNGKTDDANEIMKRWSWDQTTEELNTFDLQNIWYEVESGNSHYSQKRFLEAFKTFNFIQKHIDTMHKDIYDLHFFTVRKFNLRAYLDIGKMQDDLRRNVNVRKGIIGYLKTCNKLYKKYENKEEFKTWLDEKLEEHKVEEPETNWEEYDPPHDPVDKLTDPNGARELEKLTDKGLINPVVERCQELLGYNPDFVSLHYYSLPWLLRGRKYEAAIRSLQYLITHDQDSATTVYSALKFRSFVEDESVASKLKEKQKKNLTNAIEEVFKTEDSKTFFTKNCGEKHSESLLGQRYFLKGLKKFLGVELTKDHFQNVFSILEKAKGDNEFKSTILPQIDSMRKIVDLAPEETREQLVDQASEVFYNFKNTLPGDKKD